MNTEVNPKAAKVKISRFSYTMINVMITDDRESNFMINRIRAKAYGRPRDNNERKWKPYEKKNAKKVVAASIREARVEPGTCEYNNLHLTYLAYLTDGSPGGIKVFWAVSLSRKGGKNGAANGK